MSEVPLYMNEWGEEAVLEVQGGKARHRVWGYNPV